MHYKTLGCHLRVVLCFWKTDPAELVNAGTVKLSFLL